MKKCIYFASERDFFPERPGLALGFGFTGEGSWRALPVPKTEALAVDDRFPPGPGGLREAARFLRSWNGWILWDFERPPQPALLELMEQAGARESVVLPAWVAAPHTAVLVGPYRPGCSFRRWLELQKKRFGSVVLDAAPIRHRCRPGCGFLPWDGPLPARASPCPGAGCLCARTEDGFLYWDTRQTLAARCGEAAVPAIALAGEWEAAEAG